MYIFYIFLSNTRPSCFLFTLANAEVPPCIHKLHASTESESWVKCYPVTAVSEGQEFDSSWEKSMRNCTPCLLSWTVDASEMFWSKFVVVVQEREIRSVSALSADPEI